MIVETMRWQDGKLILLDQTKLPEKIAFITCQDYERVILAIKKLEVRGAPAIGAAAAFAMVLAFRGTVRVTADLSTSFRQAAAKISSARPTAKNLAWSVDLCLKTVSELQVAGVGLSEIAARLEKLALKIYQADVEANKKMGEYGSAILPEKAVILTHCNAGALATCGWGTALGVIRSGFKQGRVQEVYADETRPLLQGARLTAWELLQEQIPATLICDNMAAWTMKTKGINLVLTGADRIAANGDAANKIGTCGLAVLAKAAHIPFYIAAPGSTFDFNLPDGSRIPIEERAAEEVSCFYGKKTAPAGIRVFNPAFDVTPAELISGIITEYGVLRAPYALAIANLKQQILKEEHLRWKV
jgi:methylthioribose-1-phosphate isomerase